MAAVAEQVGPLEIGAFLEQEHKKDLLRFTTAGSVDDGKSTLIGRLLYDSKNVYEDQIQSVAKVSKARGGVLDLSLLTDGLRAEREQGITIDVAYRYFSTVKRKFIIADTPGHEQYTRNMATGASTADLAIILVDARNGVLPQSRRHAYISHLLGIPKLVVAINKMDAVGYDQAVFDNIRAEFGETLRRLGETSAYFLPLSALVGDNVTERSTRMPWFEGPSLLEYLETVDVPTPASSAPLRFPVQYVIRPDQDFRGYAGQIGAGAVRVGDEVLALPAGLRSRVHSISTFDGNLDAAYAPMSVTITLEDEIDISRGDILVSAQHPPHIARNFEANVVWMSQTPLDVTRPLLLKHTTQTVRAELRTIVHRIDIAALTPEPAETLEMNGIGVVQLETSRPLYLDAYQTSRGTGAFILIDPVTNATVGAGMVRTAFREERRRTADQNRALEAVTPAERLVRFGHTGTILPVGRLEVAQALERKLFDHGCAVVILPADMPETALRHLQAAGLIVLTLGPATRKLPEDAVRASEILHEYLEQTNVLTHESLTQGEGI